MKLEHTSPKDAGLDAGRLAVAENLVVQGLEAAEYTAAVYLVARHGKIAASQAFGRLGDEGEPEARVDSIFDMASVTKPVATAASLMVLVEQGAFHLSQPVTDFFPDSRLPHLSDVTLKHLATHTSGLPAWRDLYSDAQCRDDVIDRLLHTPLDNRPGTKRVYSCLGYIVLCLAIEQASGKPLAEFASQSIFRPLRMVDTGFNPPKEKADRIVRTANSRGRDGTLVGEAHDENAHAMEGNSGNAGLFSTAPDLAIFAQMTLNRGEYGGTRILSPLSIERMLTNQIDPSIGGQGYGWFTQPSDMVPCGDLFSVRAAGHTGFTGTSVLIDPEHDVFVILLTNRVYKARESPQFLRRRRLFHNAVASAVV